MSQESVLNLLKKNGKMTSREIKKKLKISNGVNYSLKALQKQHLIIRRKSGTGINNPRIKKIRGYC